LSKRTLLHGVRISYGLHGRGQLAYLGLGGKAVSTLILKKQH
jgi:hypothetical protein